MKSSMSFERQIFILVLMSALLTSLLLSIDKVGQTSSADATSTDSALPQREVEYLFLESVEKEKLDSNRLRNYTLKATPHMYCCDSSTTISHTNLVYNIKNQRIDNSIDIFKKVGQRLYQVLDIPPPLL